MGEAVEAVPTNGYDPRRYGSWSGVHGYFPGELEQGWQALYSANFESGGIRSISVGTSMYLLLVNSKSRFKDDEFRASACGA